MWARVETRHTAVGLEPRFRLLLDSFVHSNDLRVRICLLKLTYVPPLAALRQGVAEEQSWKLTEEEVVHRVGSDDPSGEEQLEPLHMSYDCLKSLLYRT